MKSAEKKETGGEEAYDTITVKTERQLEQETAEDDEGSSDEEYTINGDDLNILIKEEPESWEIDEDNCVKITLDDDTVSQDPQEHIKDEFSCSYDDLLEYESSEAAVKEETESFIKESPSEEEAEEEDADNIEDDFEEDEVIPTGEKHT